MRRPKIKTKHLQQLTKIIFVILLIISLFVPTFSAFAFEVEAINTIDLQNRTAWQNLPKYTELGQNYQSEVVDQMKSFQQNPDQFLSNQSVSAEQKEKLIDDLDKISLHGVAKKLDDIQSDVEKEALYNQLDSDDESTIDSLKQAQIIDTYIDPVSKEEKIIDPLLVETDGYLTAKATPHNLQIPDHSNQSLSLSFSGIEENSQAVDYNLSFSPVSTNNVEVGFEDNQALYADAWNNVDAVYSSQSNGVKEDLVLKSDPTDQTDIRQSGYQGNGNWIFYYKLNLTNLTPAIVNNKVVYKNSAGNIVATSTSPYLIDNQGEISQNAYYDLITDETYQAGYQIDQSKFNLVSSDENDQTVVVHPTSDSDESDQTKPISTTVDESDQTAAAVIQTTEHSRSLFDMISEAIKYVINIFAGSRTMAEENDQTIPSAVNNDNYESDQTIAPIDQIGQEDNAAQIIDQTPVVSYSYLVLVANTAQLQYPIDIDPTTYILTQSNLYNTTNGKLLSNNVNDVKVYDTTKEISSNYSENLKLKNTLSFNNSIAEFDLTSTNIAGQWSFDERSGSTAIDSSSHSYDGSLDQSPGRINGKMNSALSFNGSNQSVIVDDQDEFSFIDHDFAISAWVNPDNNNQSMGVLGKGGSSNWEYYLGLTNHNAIYFVAWQINGAEHFSMTTADYAVKNHEWSNIVVTNQDNVSASIYIDGTMKATTVDYAGSMDNGDADLFIGKAVNSSSTDYFSGAIDEVRIYRASLSSTDIASLYQNTNSKLLGWWPLDGNAFDMSGNNNHGTNNGATTNNNGYDNQAYDFSVPANIDITSHDNLSPSDQLSIEAWVKTDSSSVGQIQNLVTKDNQYSLNICADGRPMFSVHTDNGWQNNAGTGYSCQDSTAPIINDNTWHYLVGNYDGRYLTLYIDNGVGIYYYHPGDISTSTNNLNFGENFSGTLDQIAIYGRVLSSDEIAAHFSGSIQSGINTSSNFDNAISYAENSQLALDNLVVERSGVLQIKGTNFADEAISEKIKLRSGQISRVLSSERYKSITQLSALNEDGNTGENSLVISSGQLLAFSPYFDANWRYGINKVDDHVSGLWHMNEGTGNTISDSSGANNTGFLAAGESDQSWLYSRTISISPSTSTDDYQQKITLTPTTFDYINANSNGDDLRFFNTNGVALSYWIQSWNYNGDSTIWVKIPHSGTSEIMMKYGNLSAASQSNGDDTFTFFDDFSGTSLDTDKWLKYDNGSYISQDEKLIVSGGSSAWGSNGLTSKATFVRANNYELNFDYHPASGSDVMFGWHDSGTGTSYTDLVYADYDNNGVIKIYEDNNNRGTISGSWLTDSTYHIKMALQSSGGNNYLRSNHTAIDDNFILYNSTYSTETPLKVGITNYNKSFEIDNLFVRHSATVESTATVNGVNLVTENYSSQANWYDSTWQHRAAVYLNNSANNNDLTDFQMPIRFDSSSLISAGEMQNDVNDLRITDSDGTTLTSIWYESGINTSSTTYWIKLSSVPAKTIKAIYLYYGYSGSPSSAISFDNVFTKNSLDSGLISSWHLDDGSGTTAANASAYNIPLSIVNGPVWQGSDGGQWGDVSGQTFSTGSHLNLDGTDDYLQVPINPAYNFGTNDWTISTWFSPNAITTCDEIWAQNNPYNFLRMYCSDATRWEIYNNGVQYVGPTHNMTAGNWYFLMLVRRNNHMYLYKNNVLVWDFSVGTNATNFGNAVWRFGGSSWATEYFNSKFDEIKIYNRALENDEMQALYERRQTVSSYPNVTITSSPPTSSFPSWDSNGKFGSALSFDGQDDYTVIPNNDTINPSNGLTIGAWIKPMAKNGWLYTQSLTLSPATTVDNYQIDIPLTTANFAYDKAKPDGSDLRFSDSQGNNLNYWIANWDQNSTSHIWVKIPDTGTSKIFMYYGNSDATDESNFDAVMTKSFDETNVVGLWHMDEGGSSSTTADSSGQGHTATLNNSPTWQTTDGGQWGSRPDANFDSGSHINFNGSNQYLSVADSDDWDFGTGDFAVDFWIKIPANATQQTIIGNRINNGTNNSWNLEFYTTANRLEWHTASTIIGTSSSTVVVGQWNHIAFTRTSGTDRFYINGSVTNSFSDTYNYNGGQTLYIGKDGHTSGTGQLNGYLDEIRVIKGRALSAGEVSAQYNRRAYAATTTTVNIATEAPASSTSLYQQTVTISPATVTDNYPLKVELNSGNFDYSRSRSDGGDLRFYDNDGNNLAYFIDDWQVNGASTIYVSIPNSGTSQIKMIYGDKTLFSQSNCQNVLDFCDDFSNGHFDDDLWGKINLEESDWNEGVTESDWFMLKANNGVNLSGDDHSAPMILSQNSFGNADFELTARLKFGDNLSSNYQQAGLIVYEDDSNYLLGDIKYDNETQANLSLEYDNTMASFGETLSINDAMDIKIKKEGILYTLYYKNSSSNSWTQHGTPVVADFANPKVGFTAFANAGSSISSYFDYVNLTVSDNYQISASLGSEHSWNYKRAISFSPAIPADDYQTKVTLANATFDYAHAASDGRDLRFYSTDGEKLSYWIESWTVGGDSVIWVKVPYSGTDNINMYYGNSSAVSESDGFNVFDYFDDFEDSTWTNSHWTSTGTLYSVSSGMLYHPTTLEPTNSWPTYTLNDSSSFTNGIIEAKMQPLSCGSSWGKGLAARYQDDNNLYTAGLEAWTANMTHIGRRVSGTWTNLDQDTLACSTSTWYNLSWTLSGQSQTLTVNGVTSSATDSNFSQGKIGLSVDNRETATGAYWDNFRVRKYVSSVEPISTLASETRWQYKKSISLSPATPLADYQVKIELNSSNFDYQNARDDGGDLRFFDTSGNQLNYWVERWDKNGQSVIWVKVPTQGSSSIVVMYGNSTAESVSNGEATFDFFDDFDDHALDADKWSWLRENPDAWDEGYTRDDQLFVQALYDTNLWQSDNSAPILLSNDSNYTLPSDFEIMASLETDLTSNYQQAGLIYYESDQTHVQAMRGYDDGQVVTFKNEASDVIENSVDENQTSNYSDIKLRKDGDSYSMFYKNNNVADWTEHGTTINTDIVADRFGLTSYSDIGPDANTYYDNVRVRKYSVSDPVATIDTEQVADSEITDNLINKGSSFSMGSTDSQVFATIGDQTLESSVDTDWNHVVMTYDGQTQKIYVNGKLKSAADYDLTSFDQNNDDYIIGDGYYGLVDDLVISKQAMSDSQVTDWYNSGIAYEKKQPTEQQTQTSTPTDIDSTGQIGHWNLDETSGTVALDSSGKSHNGVVYNATVVEGKEGQARNFVADNDYINIPDSTDWTLSNDYSMSAWINPDNISSDARGIMGTYNGSSNGFMFALDSSTAGNPTLIFWSNGVWNYGPSITMDGTWKHVTYVKQNNVGTFYVDGLVSGAGVGYAVNDGGALQIGSGGTSWNSNRFDGRIDDARIYNRALSETEVYTLAHLYGSRLVENNVTSQASTISVSGNQSNPQAKLAIRFVSPGPVGIATYKTSIDGGQSWSTNTYTTALTTSTLRYNTTSTGLDIDFAFGTDYVLGDTYQIASWYTEPKSENRGITRAFPTVANIIATDQSIEIIDQSNDSLWMRFDNSTENSYLGGQSSNIQSVDMAYGNLLAGNNQSTDSTGLLRVNFIQDSGRYYRYATLPEILSENITSRNTANNLLDDNMTVLNNTVINDVAIDLLGNELYMLAATDDGLNIVHDQTNIIGSRSDNAVQKVSLSNNGDVALVLQDNDTSLALSYAGIQNIDSDFSLNDRVETYLADSTSGWQPDYRLLGDADTETINDISLQNNSSLADQASNSLLIGTSAGANLVSSSGNYFTNIPDYGYQDGFIKYLTGKNISESVNGHSLVRGLWIENDQTNSSTITDHSLSGHNLTVHGFAGNGLLINSDWENGVRGQSLKFDGVDDYLTTADHNDFDFSQHDNFSFGGWVKPSSSSDQSIISQTDGTNSNTSFALHTLSAGDNLEFQASIGSDDELYSVNSNEHAPDEWHQVIGVVDQDKQLMQVFVDGQLESDVTIPSSINNSDADLSIGAGVGGSQYFAGHLSDLFITAHALSASQIKNIYQVGLGALNDNSDDLNRLGGNSNVVLSVAQDADNHRAYFGTDDGLSEIDLSSDSRTNLWQTDSEISLPDNSVKSLSFGNNHILSGTSSGAISISTDGSYTSSSLGKLQSGRGRDVYTDGANNYYVSDLGLDVVRLSDLSNIGYAEKENGFTSVVSFGGRIYLGSDEGVWEINTDDLSGEYDLSTPALTTFTYPRLISNNILDIHGRLIDGKQYLVIGTDKGAQLISNLSGSSYSTTFKYNDDDNVTKVWLNEDGDLAYYNATTKKVCIYQDAISSDLYFEQIGTSSYTRYYDQSTTPALMDNIVNDLVYSANTSTAQTGSNTLYVGTRNGLSVVQEHSTMASGTVKHYVAKVAYDERTGLFVPLSSSFAPGAFDTQTYNSVDSNDSLRQRLNLTSDPHLAGYWDFDQTVPTGVADRSGHGNNGAFGYDTGVTGGQLGQSLYLSGDQGYVNVGNDVSLHPTNAFSWEGWVWKDASASNDSSAEPILASKYDSGNNGEFVIYYNKNNKLQLRVSDGENSVLSTESAFVSPYAWHHLAVTFSSGRIQFYIDGHLDSTQTVAVTNLDSPPYNNQPGSMDDLYIGNDWQLDQSAFGGYIDEVAYYTKALSSEEVSNHYSLVDLSDNGAAINNQDNLSYPSSAQIVSANNAQETMRLNFDGSLADIHGAMPSTMIETSWQRPTLNLITYSSSTANNIVLDKGATGAWDETFVQSPKVIKEGDTYKMWYTGGDSSGVYRLGYATSSDGITWTKYAVNNCAGTSGNGCVMDVSSGQFDSNYAYSADIIKEGNTYKMWYTGYNGSGLNIGYATSSDGINWSKQNGGNPVLAIGSSGSWDDYGVAYPTVIKEGTLYKMWYSGEQSAYNFRLGYATSSDGLNWTKYDDSSSAACGFSESNDSGCLVGLGSSGAFDESDLEGPNIFKNNNRYYLSYFGRNSSAVGTIGMLTSENGLDWSRTNDNAAVMSLGSGWDSVHNTSHSIIDDGNQLKMYYSGWDSSNGRIGLATMQFGYGRYSQSLYIGNNDQYIYDLDQNTFNGRTGTISLWSRLDSATDAYHELFNIFSSTGNTQDGLYLSARGDNLQIGYNGQINQLSSVANFSANQWNNFVITWEKPSADNRNLKIYINGQLAESAVFSAAISSAFDRLQLGGNPSESRDYLKGYIDDFRIYNLALSTSNVAELYSGSLGVSSKINYDQDSVTATPNPQSEGTVEFLFSPDWNSATDNSSRTLFDSLGGNPTKVGRQYRLSQTSTNRFRIWKDEGDTSNTNDRLHFGVIDNDGDLYEVYSTETINFASGSTYKIAAMWDLDNNDLTSSGTNLLRLIVDGNVVAGDNYASSVIGTKTKNGSATSNTEPIIITAIPEKSYLGGGQPNQTSNLLSNASFENSYTGLNPAEWDMSGTVTYDQSGSNSKYGSRAVSITGPTSSNNLSQTITNLPVGTYTASWWSKGNASTDSQNVTLTYSGGSSSTTTDPGTGYIYQSVTFTSTGVGNLVVNLSATSGETVWYDGFTIVAGRMNENYQSSSGGSLRDFKTTNYLMSQEEINAERLAETYNTTNNNASLAGETNNVSALAVKTVNTVANSSDDIVFVGTKGYASEGAISEITFGTTDYRTHEYRQTTSGTGLTSNRINSLSYSLVRNNLAVATDDAGIFGIMEETPAVITLNSPLGSEEWEGGSSQTISWTTDGVCEYVNLDYSLDGGTNYDHTIVHNLADAGSYIWNPVDEINSNNVQTRIQCLDAGGNVLASDANDQSLIIDSTSPQVTLHAISNPNGDNVIYGRGEATDVGGATSINRVQYRVDENDWQDALISVNSGTTDVEYDFSTAAISSGAHTIYVRAKDSSLPNGNETDQTIAVSRSFNVDELTVSFSKSSFSTDLDLNSSQIFTDSTVVTVTGLGTAYNLGIKANNIPTNQIYPSETLPFYTGNDNWTGNTKGFGWRYENYNHGYYNPFPTDAYEYLASGKANSNGVTHQIDFKAVVDWTVDAGTYNSDVSIIVTPRY